jgi:hypothetical protein
VILYPALSALELLRSILDDLHITSAGPSLKDQVDAPPPVSCSPPAARAATWCC